MEVFHVDPANFQSLGPILGIEKMIWIERYSKPGEFTIIGDPVPLMANLPIDRFISTSLSEEVMVVESHFIDESENKDGQTKVIIKGTSIPNYIMGNRVVSYNPSFAPEGLWAFGSLDQFANVAMNYAQGPSTTSINNFLYSLLLNHLKNATGQAENLFNLVVVDQTMSYAKDISNYVTKNIQYLNDVVYSCLDAYDLGLRSARPGVNRYALDKYANDNFYNYEELDLNQSIMFALYIGNDLSESVIFDINNGDAHNARYFWTGKKDKNAFYAATKDYALRQFPEELEASDGWKRKVLRVDLDDYYPPEYTNEEIWGALYTKGIEALLRSNGKGLILDAVGTKNAGPKYGFDYRVGDIIMIIGNYGVSQKMRVSEVAITQDGDNEEVVPIFRPVYIEMGTPPM